MENRYILAVDQSTQGTKAVLFDAAGKLIARADKPHKQMISDRGWVEHDGEEIARNVLQVAREVIEKAGIDRKEVAGLGVSNQRETVIAWDSVTGKPVYNAIVWQCARGEAICKRLEQAGYGQLIQQRTGLPLSPYFSAAKLSWLMENVPEARELAEKNQLCCGTMDTWVIWQLTAGRSFCTDVSNGSRTQLFDIEKLCWDQDICKIFGVPATALPRICDSDAMYGMTDLEGFLPAPIPIHGVLGDSHGALLGQGCIVPGSAKATYGTGSSVMMQTGKRIVRSESGLATSLAWSLGGKACYVLEGNINYTGAIISWLKDDLGLILTPGETEELATNASVADRTYLVPAFTGLGAPYWNSHVRGLISGMSRVTGKNELVRAALDSIAYQITDVINIMEAEAQVSLKELKVDGGPARNNYLMQFQSDIAGVHVEPACIEELSAAGAAFAADMALGIYNVESIFKAVGHRSFTPRMDKDERAERYYGWKKAIEQAVDSCD